MAKKNMSNKMITVTQTKSTIGALANHKACLKGLGIRRMNHTVEVIDTPQNRGMINKAIHLLTVQETK